MVSRLAGSEFDLTSVAEPGMIITLGVMLSIAAGCAAPFAVDPRLRASVPLLAWWFCSTLGVISLFYCLSISTVPSFAPRITATGKIYDCVERHMGKRTSKFGFSFVPEHGDLINLETLLIIPRWGNAEKVNGRICRIVYLDDKGRDPKNEAIEIEIVKGDHAGWHDSLDARPFGFWLGIPFGLALIFFGVVGSQIKNDKIKITDTGRFGKAPR